MRYLETLLWEIDMLEDVLESTRIVNEDDEEWYWETVRTIEELEEKYIDAKNSVGDIILLSEHDFVIVDLVDVFDFGTLYTVEYKDGSIGIVSRPWVECESVHCQAARLE